MNKKSRSRPSAEKVNRGCEREEDYLIGSWLLERNP